MGRITEAGSFDYLGSDHCGKDWTAPNPVATIENHAEPCREIAE